MVMHARKLPRIDDGYYDCHSYQELKNNSSDRKLVRDRRGHNLVNDRQGSPTYRHKHISVDRRKLQRDRNEDKYNRDAEYDMRLEESSVNTYDRLASNHLSDYKSMETRTDSHTNISRNRESVSKSEDNYKKSTVSGKSNAAGSAKVEAQKTALRVCGDWSEHVSSSGKKYFYNCKTEVSQWVKPKEWKVDESGKQGRAKTTASGITKGDEDTSRNGMTKHNERLDSPSRVRYDRVSEDSRRNIDSDSRTGVHDLKCNNYQRSISSVSQRNNTTHEQTTVYKDVNNYHILHRNNDRSSSVTSTPSSSIVDTSNGSPGAYTDRAASSDRLIPVNGVNSGSGDDMDISPDASPRQHMERQHSEGHNSNDRNPNGKPANGSQLLDRQPDSQQSSNADQSVIWGKALQTLQTLQEVLEKTRSASNQPGAPVSRSTLDSPRSATSQSSPRMISLAAQQASVAAAVIADLPDCIASVPGDKSPTASEASLGQHSVLSSVAESSTSSNVMLAQSLTNYYDPSLVGHISDWPGEQIELRAHMAYRDGMVICGQHCGQVSTELKRDRSHVRIAEVQSTLIEHRILFLKQQISELETQDKNFSASQT